jgi:hypothetical protein
MDNICHVIDFPPPPIAAFIVFEVGILLLTLFCAYHFLKDHKEALMRLFIVIGALFVFFIFFVVSGLFFAFRFFSTDHPPSENYHVLNAAIKNTCYLDPTRNHCPRTAADVISIESINFSNLTKDAHLTYQYYPETNQYTLIVRDNNLAADNGRVVVFDPRLATGSGSNGLDFEDTDLVKCGSHYQLKKSPPFPGPWNQIN